MTEEEAKTKWCPMVRQAGHSSAYNRDAFGDDCSYTCIGSKCMMWEWTCFGVHHELIQGTNTPMKSDQHVKKCDGYCGLAGT